MNDLRWPRLLERLVFVSFLLSVLLAGEKSEQDIVTHSAQWYADQGITLHSGDPVARIDRVRREIHGASGRTVPYDRLLIATGSNPFLPPIPGSDLDGVLAFRDLGDVAKMLEAAREHREAVVIGVSKDSVASHDKFKKKYALTFTLASDDGGDVCERYGVWG